MHLCLLFPRRSLGFEVAHLCGRGIAQALAGLLSLSLMAFCASAASGTLHHISVVPGETPSYQLEITTQPSRVSYFELDNPPRFAVDLYDTQLAADLITSASINGVPGSRVEAVRLGKHKGPRVRVVFDLKTALGPNDDVSVTTTLTEPTSLVSVTFAAHPVDQEPDEQSVAKETSSSEPVKQQSTATIAAGLPSKLNAEEKTKQSKSLVFGSSRLPRSSATTDTTEKSYNENSSWNYTVDRLLFETGHSSGDLGTGANTHLQLVIGAERALSPNWSVRLGARVDGHVQSNDLPELEYLRIDYDETWIRYQSDNLRITAGAQRIIWGRADEFSPTDRLSTRDFTRLVLDDLQDRRRANPALRLQWFNGNRSLDLVYLPVFREAELPADESLWSPFDSSTGAVAGLPLGDAPPDALRRGILRNDFKGNEGFGARFSDSKNSWDYALTIQRVNNPEPYFTLQSAPTPTTPAVLGTIYPRTWLVGGDLAVAAGAWTFRGEAAWLSDSLYTSASDFSLQQTEELNWALGAEVFPGDRDLRLTFQVSGRHLIDTRDPVDFTDVLSAVGELETPFVFGGLPWRAQLRYSFRLDETGSYINPELSFMGWEPSELYLGAHFFDGDYGTLEGYYSQRDMIVLGWRAKF